MNKQTTKKSTLNKSAVLRALMVLVALVTVVLAIVFIVSSNSNNNEGIIYNVTIEAGEEFKSSMFVYGNGKEAVFYEDIDMASISRTPGAHTLKILVDGQIYNVTLTVKDTIAPTAKVIPMLLKLGTPVSAESMVKDIIDVTDVKVSFERSPNMAVEGKQNVTIKLVDAGGNVKSINSSVYVTSDVKVPEWEIGYAFPSVTDFSKSIENVVYQNQSDFTSIKTPGEYLAALRITVVDVSDTYYAPFKAVDTIAPVVTPKENYIYDINTEMPAPEDLISEYIEYTEIKFEYLDKYSISEPGVYTLKVKATDSAENSVVVNITVNAIDGRVDNGAPIITVNSQINITVGSQYDLSKYVSIYDDKDGDISIDDASKVAINSSNVNNMLPGTYYLLVTVTDSSGKEANATVTVVVSHIEISRDEVIGAVDEYLNKIINEDMNTSEKIKAVFDSIAKNQNSSFTGKSDKKNELYREAYYGIKYNYGDSYTVACMLEVMLSRFNVNSMIVERIGGKQIHYWNLVDFSDGWYHVDASAHDVSWVVDGEEKETYKLTDGELSAYTEFYNTVAPESNYYVFNTSVYPSTPVLTDNGYIYNTYKVIYGASEGGYIEGDTDQDVFHGLGTQTVKAIPASGYKFIGWSDGVKTAERSDIVYGSLSVTAMFEQESSVITKTYILNYTANEGGSISGATRQSVKSGFYGSEVVAIPAEGYKFAGWSDGVTTASRSDVSKGNMTVIAYFVLDDGSTYTIEYKASLGGTISGICIQIVKINGMGEAVVAIPAAGYVFNCWSDGVTTAERSDVATSDMTLTAYFVREDATLYRVEYIAAEGGYISGIATQSVVEGSYSSTVTAVAERGYVFAGWSDGITTTKRNDLALGNVSVTAYFIKLTPATVTYKTNNDGGIISGNSVQQIYPGESTETVTAVANEGYRFIGWSDGVMTAERSDSSDTDMEVIAIFEERTKYTFTYTASEGGLISGEAVQTVYIDLTGSVVTAVANEGYRFIGWSDGVETAERSDIASGDISVEALFVALNKYNVNYVAGVGGTIEGTLVWNEYEGTVLQSVTAVADEGYEFIRWSDGLTDATRSDVVSGDVTYTAEFAPVKIYTITYYALQGGYIDGTTTQELFINQQGSVVTAVANEGYEFVEWSDGLKNAERSDVAKDGDKYIIAIFREVSQAN